MLNECGLDFDFQVWDECLCQRESSSCSTCMTSCVMLQVVYLNIYDYAFAYWCIYMCGITILNCGLMQIGWFDTNEQIQCAENMQNFKCRFRKATFIPLETRYPCFCSAGTFEEFDQILVFAHTSAFSSLSFPILTAATEEAWGTKTFLGKQTRAQKGSRRHYLYYAFYPNSFHK